MNSAYQRLFRFQLECDHSPIGEKRSSKGTAKWFTAVTHFVAVLGNSHSYL